MRDASELHLWSDSCTGQNKNNIVMAYLMLLVHNGMYKALDWRFFAVGYSKFDPDRMFGAIRSALHSQTVLTTPQLKGVIDSIAGIDRAVLFDASNVRDWHGAMSSFHSVPNIRKVFYYRMCVRMDHGDLVVHTHDAPDTAPTVHRLLRAGRTPPALDDVTAMPYLAAPLLSQKRREDLGKTVLGYILKAGRGTPDVAEFWRGIIGDTAEETPAVGTATGDASGGFGTNDAVEEVHLVTPPRGITPHMDTTPSPRTGDGVVAAVAAGSAGQIAAEGADDQARREIACERRAKRRCLLNANRSGNKR